MNPRQRRGALLILLAAIGAVAVFLTISSYVSDVRSQVAPMSTVVQLNDDVPAFHPVTSDHVEEVEIPERWVPDGALQSIDQLSETTAANDLEAGSILQAGMTREPIEIPGEQRELAILVDAETGVAGKVRPGDRVDVFATFPGGEGPEGEEPASAEIVIADALVIDVGEAFMAEPESENPASVGAGGTGSSLPVTFALPVDDSLVLAYVESFATSVRLGLKAPDSAHEVAEEERIYERYEGEAVPGVAAVESALESALRDLESAVDEARGAVDDGTDVDLDVDEDEDDDEDGEEDE